MQLARRGELAAAAALGCLYLALTPGHYQSMDGMLMFQQARSLLYDGSLFFREPFLWDGVYETSLYGIGQSLAYMPTLALFSGFEPLVFEPGPATMDLRRIYLDVVYALAAAPVQALLTAFAAHRVASIVRLLGYDRRASLWALTFFGLASPALVYSGSDFSQPLTTACVVVAVDRALHFRRSAANRDLTLCSAAVAYAVLTRPLDAGLLLPFICLTCVGCPQRGFDWKASRQAFLILGLPFALACGITLFVNFVRYGAVLHNEYVVLGASFVAPATGVIGLLASPARGLLWAFPAIWLVPAGLRATWRSPQWRPGAAALIGFPLALLLVTGSWHSWWGGVCYGPRFLLPTLPLLAVLAGVGLTQLSRRWRTASGWSLLVAGIAYAAPGVSTDLFAGYGSRIATSAGSYSLENYPPVAAWQFTTHLFATSPLDRHAVDIVWFRTARQTGFLSLIPFVGLMTIATWLGWRVHQSLRRKALSAPEP